MADKVYTISEVTKAIKQCIEENPYLNSIWIKGEISNLTYHSSGHIYLSLKDNDSVISSAFFKYSNRSLNFRLEEGMSILAFGSVNIFEKRGTYQFIIAQVRLEGVGELLKRIEQLKKKLLEEGIFENSHKKKLPFLPKRLGIVTSPTGAALRDIIKVAARRYPNIEILIAPAVVQGISAAESIARGIEELNDPEHEIDVIIAGRGGGSFEDLLAFNEEIVIRAFYNSRVPIISAVGHQIDHPLSDDAADYAASTPSAAAEIALPVVDELDDYINKFFLRSVNALAFCIKGFKAKLENIESLRVFRDPMEILYNYELIISDIESRMVSLLKGLAAECRHTLLSIPDLNYMIKNRIKDLGHRFGMAYNNIVNCSPAGILEKGYSIVTNAEGAVVKSVKEVSNGVNVNVLLKDGTFESTVNSVNEEEYFGKER